MPTKSKAVSPKDSSAHPGFDVKLWLNAEKLRNNMDAAEPGGVRQKMRSTARRVSQANQYEAEIVFWVSADARWSKPAPSCPPPARPWTMPWLPSSATFRASKVCSPTTAKPAA